MDRDERRKDLVISDIADGLTRGVEGVGARISGALFEPVIRLGVTGLSRAGKTVFITSLVANLMDRGRKPGLLAARDGRVDAAFLQPQPNDTLPRFEYETHLGALTGPEPHWPESTRSVSELRLSLRVRPSGLLSGLSGPRTVHLDIVDYPGEWLLDLGLLEKSYASWSEETLRRLETRPIGTDYMTILGATDVKAPLDEPVAQNLARTFTQYLHAARIKGFSDCTPGRFLLPGDLEGSPVLTFAPLPSQGASPRKSLVKEMERRFEAYKARVVRPFFRDHFARIDRQIVLVDVLGAIHRGPAAVEDLRRAMGDILAAFRHGQRKFLRQQLRGRRVERISLAATKDDRLHHNQHGRLSDIMSALLTDARRRADFAGAQTQALTLAALRATTEEVRTQKGETLDCVRGVLLDEAGGRGKTAAFYPGELPEDPIRLLQPATSGATAWLDGEYQSMRFAPSVLSLKPGEGPPHIRLDRAAQFLIGDRL